MPPPAAPNLPEPSAASPPTAPPATLRGALAVVWRLGLPSAQHPAAARVALAYAGLSAACAAGWPPGAVEVLSDRLREVAREAVEHGLSLDALQRLFDALQDGRADRPTVTVVPHDRVLQ